MSPERIAAVFAEAPVERKTLTIENLKIPSSIKELRGWIRSPRFQMRPGRNELLLKLFFSRKEDAEALIPQVQEYRALMNRTASVYGSFSDDSENEELPPDARLLIGTTIDYGLAAAWMQIQWCDRTLKILAELEGQI